MTLSHRHMAAFMATLAATPLAPNGEPMAPGEAKRAAGRGANGDALLFLSRGGNIPGIRMNDVVESDQHRAHYRQQRLDRKAASRTVRR